MMARVAVRALVVLVAGIPLAGATTVAGFLIADALIDRRYRRTAVMPPGLTCCACAQPFARKLARRTLEGWRHADGRACRQGHPTALTGGRWVARNGISRWVAT